mmetsp:Transcript_4670/g.7938  ORF Transcript_4670/g.7938 Transcript_4670/m.7938 type:complete len:122 (+) Transcript_4670:37-402(+)
MSQLIFVIEHCENCNNHAWNTRHDINQYKNYAVNIAKSIKESVPQAEIVFNMVPKQFAMSDVYCQLVHNSDEQNPYFEIVPRIGSFEISINGVLLFSKSLSGIWPNYQAIGNKCEQVSQAL